MILTGYCRLGKDAELRYTQGDNPTAVANLALAFNYGRKGEDGKRPTQWVDASLWGQRAETLAEYLLKATGLSVVLEDVHIETYQRNGGGEGSKLVGRVVLIEFAGSPPQQEQPQQQRQGNNGRTQQQRPAQQQRAAQGQGNNGRNSYSDAKNGSGRQQSYGGGGGFNEMDDDIPFAPMGARAAWSAIV